MKKKLKIIKSSFIGLSTMIPITAMPLLVISCGKHNTDKKTFADFKKAINSESGFNIVKHANPIAQDWGKIASTDLVKSKTIINGYQVTIVINAISLKQTADFEITYVSNTAYNVNNWKCTTQPHSTDNQWPEFQKAAEAESPFNIIGNAHPIANGWADLDAKDVHKIGNPKISDKTITINILSTSKNEVAAFNITYITGQVYQVSAWKCSIQPYPAISWNQFKTQVESFNKNTLFNGFKNANPDNSNINFNSMFGVYQLNAEASTITDNQKDTITFTMHLEKATNFGYNLANKKIIATIKYSGINYSAHNWETTDYTFADFKNEATTTVQDPSWKSYIIKEINNSKKTSWTVQDSQWGNLEPMSNNSGVQLSISHGHYSNLVLSNPFTINQNHKVSVFGTTAWSLGSIINDGWTRFEYQVNQWAQNKGNIKMIDVLKRLQNSPNFPISWKDTINNSIFIATPTAGKAPDKINGKLYYTIKLGGAITDNNKFNIIISNRNLKTLNINFFTAA